MRHGRPAKQRVWLGSNRYRGRCRDAVTNPEPDSYANRNSYTFCMRAGVTNTHGDCDSNGNTNSYRNCYSHGNSNSYSYTNPNTNFHAQTHAHTEVSANTEGSPHAAASTVSPGFQVICEK